VTLPLATGLYAALLGGMFAVLTVRTVRTRRKLQIGLGDAGDPQMQRTVRIHANFAEHVPFCLGLIYFVELQGAPAWLLHALGSLLLFARLSHAYGLSKKSIHLRVIGVTATLTVLLTACTYLLFNFLK
jgi:uncharacterized protein